MQNRTFRTAILSLFVLLNFYCYGARLIGYFAIYESWRLMAEKTFAAFHHSHEQIIYWLLSSRFIL